ncbi:O-Methyltransferase [Marasmius crinis-equi]|uniref:O-Methyltransferase n=1 Tax=Marasmius crinis-equi TaxID=585013 RepID=A0ABR3EMH9_9AGAR
MPSHNTQQNPPQAYNQETWTREDKYHQSFLIPEDETPDFAVQNSNEKGLPDIAVSPLQGKLLYLISKSIAAKRILEIGTLGGYSAIWLSRSLPADGKLVTLELEDKHAKVARENLNTAGEDVSDRVEIIVGSAHESLAQLKPEPQPFDLVFIDADEDHILTYYTEGKRLVRSGGVIIVDNMVRRGGVSDPANEEPANLKNRELLSRLKEDAEVEATTIGTAGVKGYDGFTYIVKK